MNRTTVLILLLAAATPRMAAAQQRAEPVAPVQAARATTDADRETNSTRARLRPLRIAKWSTLAASLAAAGYGFAVHTDANETFTRLEQICEAQPDRCRQRTSDGAYRDQELEEIFQDVVRLDDRARLALVGSQVALAGSVVLFILDLRENTTPPNVPYEPPRFRFAPRRDGAAELRFSLPLGGG